MPSVDEEVIIFYDIVNNVKLLDAYNNVLDTTVGGLNDNKSLQNMLKNITTTKIDEIHLGKNIENVVVKYSAPHLRPSFIVKVDERNGAWSFRQLLVYLRMFLIDV